MFLFISTEASTEEGKVGQTSGATEVAELTLRMLTYQNINSSERAEYAPYYDTSVGVAFSILSLLGKKDISCLSLMFVCPQGRLVTA